MLIINLGTPRSPSIKDVKAYLHEFLLDPRVIDIPRWKREFLVRLLIVPSRVKQTANSYEKIWMKQGSPLLFWGETLKEKLQSSLGDEFFVELAMRYQSPSIQQKLETLKGCGHLIIVPLFPQYASATTGSIFEAVMKELSTWNTQPTLNMLSSYPTDAKMIGAFAERARKVNYQEYEHILFSFHGLPIRHLIKSDICNKCQTVKDCCAQGLNPKCYAAECFMTAHAIAKALNLSQEKFKVTFQSRLGKEPWLEPSTQDVVKQMAKEGIKKVLIFSPSFVADCLETLFEIAEELKSEFCHLGGETLNLVPSLNDHPLWIESLSDQVRRFPKAHTSRS